MNSWDFLGAFTELTFSLNVTFVCIQWADFAYHWLALFFLFFETIHDPFSAIFCPLGPNVNRWGHPRRLQRTHISRFCDLCEHNGQIGHVFVICVGIVGRLGIPLAFPIFC